MLTSEEVRNSFKYLYPAELPFLKKLVQSVPAGSVVINIGAGAGTSGLAILEARPDVTLVTVDITDASSPFGCLEAERDVISRAGMGYEFGHRWFQYHGRSVDFLRALQQSTSVRARPSDFELWDGAGMIFIDGDHSYEGCKEDIILSLPLIMGGGILAVHDYDKGIITPTPDGPHPKVWEGVNQAVDELLVPRFKLIGRVDSLIAFDVGSIDDR